MLNPFIDEQTIKLHLRVQQRNARQKITTISGLPLDYDAKGLLTKIKRQLCCNGSVQEENILQLTGDQRSAVAELLVKLNVVARRDLTIHGY